MLIEIKPVAIYGAVFKTREEAKDFIESLSVQYINGAIRFANRKLFGLERFSADTWVVGFEMNLGETFEKYEKLWNDTCIDICFEKKDVTASGSLYVRIPNGFNE